MPDLTPLVESGIVGICIALIMLFGLMLRWFLKLVGNHMNHNTEVLTKLVEKIDNDVEAQKDTAEALRDLKAVIHK